MVEKGKTVPGSVLSALESRHRRASAIIEENPDAIGLRDRLKNQALSQEQLLVAIQPDVGASTEDEYNDAFAAVHNSYFVTENIGRQLLAEELSNGVIRVSGVVSVLEDGTWTVGGVEVDIDELTIKRGEEVTPGASAEFTIAEASNGRRRVLSVSNVRLPSQNVVKKSVVVDGEVEEIEEDRVRIAGEWYPLSQDTLVRGKPKKGEKVKVEVQETESGLVTESIRRAVGEEVTALTYEGTVNNSLDTSTGELEIGGLKFQVSASTTLDLRAGEVLAGKRARVHATVGAEGELTALSIAVLAAEGAPGEVFIIGVAESIDPEDWTVGGIEIDAATGHPPSDGDTIAVSAELIDGHIVPNAYQVVESKQTGDLTRLEGTITAIEETSWEGFGRSVRVDSRARLSGKPIEGARAILWGRNDPESGGFRAVYVRVLDQRPVVAPVESGEPDPGEGEED